MTNSYKVYVLNTTNADKPTIHVAFVQATKYGPAWQGARALLNDGKPHKEHPAIKALFSDADCKIDAKLGFGDHLTVAKITDNKARNVKLDKTKLQAILDDPAATAEEKLAAMQTMLGAKPTAPAPAASDDEKKDDEKKEPEKTPAQ